MADENLKDPMSGYASGDLLDPNAPPNRPQESKDELRDPMSGYASADTIERKPKNDEKKSQ